MTYSFSQLEDSRIREAFDVLLAVGDWVAKQGRRQRITKTTFSSYQKWQDEKANFVVSAQEEIVGLVTLRNETLNEWNEFVALGPVPMIRGLATDPAHRGKGVGEFALRQLIDFCQEHETIYLDCVSGFLPKYYSKFGFETLAEQTRYYDDDPIPYDISLMRRKQG